MKTSEAIKKAIKPKNLIILIVLLAANSFAWFVYTNRIQSEMTAHVRAWNILFEAGDSQIEDYVNVEVESMYPGMDEFEYIINAYNKSEMAAKLSFEIMEIDIMGEKYTSISRKEKLGEEILPTDKTGAELLEMLEDDFPFKISIEVSAEQMDAENGQARYDIKVNWPFESGNDELDTYWGNKSAKYKETNPDSPSISLLIQITITQAN